MLRIERAVAPTGRGADSLATAGISAVAQPGFLASVGHQLNAVALAAALLSSFLVMRRLLRTVGMVTQAVVDATSFVTGQGRQVLSVKHNQLESQGQKDYYQVKLQLGENGRKAGTTNVWVDATSTSGIVTAASGSGLSYRDTNLLPASTAQANAVKATGGGIVVGYGQLDGPGTYYPDALPAPPRIHVEDAAGRTMALLAGASGIMVLTDEDDGVSNLAQ